MTDNLRSVVVTADRLASERGEPVSDTDLATALAEFRDPQRPSRRTRRQSWLRRMRVGFAPRRVLGPTAVAAFDRAVAVARDRGDPYLGTDHLSTALDPV